MFFTPIKYSQSDEIFLKAFELKRKTTSVVVVELRTDFYDFVCEKMNLLIRSDGDVVDFY